MQDGTPTGQLDFTAPRKAEDLGIPIAMVHDIVLRQTLADGRTSTLQLSAKLRLSPIPVSYTHLTLPTIYSV